MNVYTREQLADAFECWITEARADRSKFMSDEEADALNPKQLAADSVDHLISYIVAE